MTTTNCEINYTRTSNKMHSKSFPSGYIISKIQKHALRLGDHKFDHCITHKNLCSCTVFG